MPHPFFRRPGWIAPLLIALGIAGVCWLCVSAWKSNGLPGFPLDDAWIHLQFAKNIHEFGSYSYFRDEMVTAGTTSPLYTALCAAGLFITGNEMVLSYTLGIGFFAAAAFYLFRLSLIATPSLTLVPLILFLMEPRMHWAALSGMETTLFIALMLASFTYYASGRLIALAVTLGMLIWVRPEAFLLAAIMGAGLLPTWRRWTVPVVIYAAFVLLYFLMNLKLSGTLLPNTVLAKWNFYGPVKTPFAADLAEFIGGHHFMIIAPFALLGTYASFKAFRQKGLTIGGVAVLWTAAMILVFWIKLPYLYQQGRYLMPVIPALLVLAVIGADALGAWLLMRFPSGTGAHRGVKAGAWVLLGVTIVLFGIRDLAMAGEYVAACRYIDERQIAAGKWLRDHTPPDAVVGTHDIGAIAYYSERRIVDMAGLVSPAYIPFVRQLDSLPSFLTRNHVTHLAVLRNWYEVVNVNPLFHSGKPEREAIDVFAFDPARIHIVPWEVSDLFEQGLEALSRGDLAHGGPLLESAVALDPLSSRGHLSLGLARRAAGHLRPAEESFRRAIALQPDLWQAQIALAQLEAERGMVDASIDRLRAVIDRQPGIGAAYALLSGIYMRDRSDTASAREVDAAYERWQQERRSP